MKHRIYSFMLAIALLSAFSCTKLDSETLVGEWNVEIYTNSEETVSEDGRPSLSSTHIGDSQEWCSLTFKEDGTGVQIVKELKSLPLIKPEECGERTFKWSLENGTLKLTFLSGDNFFKFDEFDASLTKSKLVLKKTVQEQNTTIKEYIQCAQVNIP